MTYSCIRQKSVKLIGLPLLIISLLTLGSGCKTVPQNKEIRAWWGSKEEVCQFLQKPEAKASRWMVQALGE